MSLDELRTRRKKLQDRTDKTLSEVHELALEANRVADIANNSNTIISSIDKEFEELTSLNKLDVSFVLFASVLQSLRWILMPKLKTTRMDELSPEIAKEDRMLDNERKHKGGIYDGKKSGWEYESDKIKEYLEKHPKKKTKSEEEYQNGLMKGSCEHRTWIEIITQKVPYDAMNAYEKELIPNIANLNSFKNGRYTNINGVNHHVATLGHDPILGWLFGTANIMTSTISFVDFQSFLVERGNRIKSLSTFEFSNKLGASDQVILYSRPQAIPNILYECFESAREDVKRVPAAVVRHSMHLASDKYCVQGLPIPILPTIDPQRAQELIAEGWNSLEFKKLLKSDFKQIGISAGISILINMMIESIYLLCLESDDNYEIRKAKSKKILSIADIISSSSNILYVALSKEISKADIGGIGVSFVSLLRSAHFIAAVKEEYIKKNFETLVLNGGRKEIVYE